LVITESDPFRCECCDRWIVLVPKDVTFAGAVHFCNSVVIFNAAPTGESIVKCGPSKRKVDKEKARKIRKTKNTFIEKLIIKNEPKWKRGNKK